MVILRVNTSFNGSYIKPSQMLDGEIVWDQIAKRLVVKGYKDNVLYTVGESGGGSGTVPDYIYAHADNEGTYKHFTPAQWTQWNTLAPKIDSLIPITDIDFENFLSVDDIINELSTSPSESLIVSEKLLTSLLSEFTKTTDIETNYINKNQINAANGVLGLNENTKIDKQYLPDDLVGGLNYKGVWDAENNIPSLGNNGVGGVNGDYYKVNVSSSNTTIDGNGDWYVGDWIIHNGTYWDKIDNTNENLITSVNGQTGDVVIDLESLNIDDVIDDNNVKIEAYIDQEILSVESVFQLSLDEVNQALANKSDINHTHDNYYDYTINDNKEILDNTTESFNTELKTKLDNIEENANNYVHPTTNGSKHIPANNSTDNGKVLTATDVEGEVEWKEAITTHATLTDIQNNKTHDDIDEHIDDTTKHIPTAGANNPNKVLMTTSEEGVYQWSDVGAATTPSAEFVTVEKDILLNSSSENVLGVLVDYDRIIQTKILLGEYEKNDVYIENNLYYILMATKANNTQVTYTWLVKKIIEDDNYFDFSYASQKNNPSYSSYSQIKDIFKNLTYGKIETAL